MTSPRQRKKRLRIKLAKERKELANKQLKVEKEVVLPVAKQSEPVLESSTANKPKKVKNALVEVKPQDQVVEQSKEEVKTQPKE